MSPGLPVILAEKPGLSPGATICRRSAALIGCASRDILDSKASERKGKSRPQHDLGNRPGPRKRAPIIGAAGKREAKFKGHYPYRRAAAKPLVFMYLHAGREVISGLVRKDRRLEEAPGPSVPVDLKFRER
jgi:hypothetical protein